MNKSIVSKLILGMFFIFFILITCANNVSATDLTITNVQFTPTYNYSPGSNVLRSGDQMVIRITFTGGSNPVFPMYTCFDDICLDESNGGVGWYETTFTISGSYADVANSSYSAIICDDFESDCSAQAGGTGSTSGYRVDTTAPTSPSIVITDNSGYTNDSTPTLTLSAADSGAGMKDMAFSCNNSDWSGWVAYNTSYSSFDITTGAGCSGGDGSRTIYVMFRDYAHNTSGTSDTTYYDITPPTLIGFIVNAGNYSFKAGQSIPLSFTFDGPVTGFASGDVTTPNLTFSTWSPQSSSHYLANYTADAIHDESNIITVSTGYTDLAGNSPVGTYTTSNYTITHPIIQSVDYNANEGSKILRVTFDEIMDASLTDVSKIWIRATGSSAGGVQLTGATVINSDSTTISITTTEAQRIAIKQLASKELDLDDSSFFEADLSFNNEASANTAISYTEDATKPIISSVTVNDATLTDADTGSAKFIATVVFNEEMDITIFPVLEFLPAVSTTLDCSGSWSNTTTFAYTCDVTDVDTNIDDIDIKVTSAEDIVTNNQMDSDTKLNKFDIDTLNPTVDSLSVNDTWIGEDDIGTNKFIVTVNFSETMTTSVNPGIVFTPSASTTLACNGVWQDSDTYKYSCNVSDTDVELADITIRITNAKDSQGNNMVAYNDINTYNIDTIPPTISIEDNASGTWVNTDFISSTPNDGLGIANTRWIISANSTCDSSKDASLNSGTLSTSLDANDQTLYRTKYICFRTMDNAGNKQYVSSAQINNLDTTVPTTSGTITSGTDGNNGWYKSDVIYTITPADALSSVASTVYCTDTNNECVPDTSYTVALTLSTGYNYVRYFSTDVAGNIQTTQSSGLIKIDKTVPVVELGLDLDINRTITKTSTVTDINGSGIETYLWTSPDAGITFGSANASETTITSDDDNTVTITLTATDYAGNFASDTFVFVWDTVLPDINSWTVDSEIITDASFDENGDYTQEVAITFSEDMNTDIIPIVSLNSESADDEYWDDDHTYIVTKDYNDMDEETNVVVSVSGAIDHAGNYVVLDNSTIDYNIDTKNPTVISAITYDINTILVTFSEDLDTEDYNADLEAFSISGVTFDGYTIDGNLLYLELATPISADFNTSDFNILDQGVYDVPGNPILDRIGITIEDKILPTLSNIELRNNHHIKLTFTEPVIWDVNKEVTLDNLWLYYTKGEYYKAIDAIDDNGTEVSSIGSEYIILEFADDLGTIGIENALTDDGVDVFKDLATESNLLPNINYENVNDGAAPYGYINGGDNNAEILTLKFTEPLYYDGDAISDKTDLVSNYLDLFSYSTDLEFGAIYYTSDTSYIEFTFNPVAVAGDYIKMDGLELYDQAENQYVPVSIIFNGTTWTLGTVDENAIDLSDYLIGDSIDGADNSGYYLRTDTSARDYIAEIPSGTEIVGEEGWDGVLTYPTVTTDIVQIDGTVNAEILIGSSDSSLTFDKAAKITITGMSGKRAAWARDGTTHLISTCSSNYENSVDATTGLSDHDIEECSMNSDNDLVIWTMHFTQFAAYTPRSGGSHIIGGSGGSSTIKPVVPVITTPTTETPTDNGSTTPSVDNGSTPSTGNNNETPSTGDDTTYNNTTPDTTGGATGVLGNPTSGINVWIIAIIIAIAVAVIIYFLFKK